MLNEKALKYRAGHGVRLLSPAWSPHRAGRPSCLQAYKELKFRVWLESLRLLGLGFRILGCMRLVGLEVLGASEVFFKRGS